MPITVHEIGPDGTLVQTTLGDDAPDAASAPAAETDTPPASAPAVPAPDPSAAPAPEEPAPPDSAPDGPETTPVTPTEDDDEEEAPAALSKGVQRRIDRLTRQREEARRQQAALEERLRMLEAGYQRPAPTPEPTPPASLERAAYATDEEWLDARIAARVSQEREQWQLEQLRQRQQQEAQAREQQWATREQAFKQQHPDYDEHVQSLAGRLAPQLWQGLSDSEQAPELAYHLARHPDELQRLNTLQPLALSRALGRLEQQLAAPPPRPVAPTPKPAPPTPLNGAGSPGPRLLTELSDADIDAMSQAEFEAAYKRQFPHSR